MMKRGFLIATSLAVLVGCAPPDAELDMGADDPAAVAEVDEPGAATGPADEVTGAEDPSAEDPGLLLEAPACGSGFSCTPIVNDQGTVFCRSKTVAANKWVTLETSIAGFHTLFRIAKPVGARSAGPPPPGGPVTP